MRETASTLNLSRRASRLIIDINVSDQSRNLIYKNIAKILTIIKKPNTRGGVVRLFYENLLFLKIYRGRLA